MLGYLTDNRDFFKGNFVEYYLKKAVAFSGGNQQHYEYFKSILNYSIINKNTNRPLHDIKAGQFTLHLFPLKLRVLLAIIYYNYENNLIQEYKNYTLQINNLLLPSTQLQFNNIILNETISEEILNLADDVVLNVNSLDTLLTYLNINNLIIDLNNSLLVNIESVFNLYSITSNNSSDYLTIIKNNDRLKALILSAKKLNYKPQSIQYLSEALTKWQQTSSI